MQIRNNGKSLSHAIGFGMLCSALIGSLYLIVGVTSFEPKNPMRFLVADSLILLVQGFLTGIVLYYSRPKTTS